MTRERAISEVMQIYGYLSSDKQQALDVLIQTAKDIDTYREPYNKGYEDGVKATNKDARIYVDDVFDEIRAEIENYVCNQEENTMKAQGMLNALGIIDKYKAESEE